MPPPFCFPEQDAATINKPLRLPVAVVFAPDVKLGSVASQEGAQGGVGHGLLRLGGCDRFTGRLPGGNGERLTMRQGRFSGNELNGRPQVG
jgi:hypothetical protein